MVHRRRFPGQRTWIATSRPVLYLSLAAALAGGISGCSDGTDGTGTGGSSGSGATGTGGTGARTGTGGSSGSGGISGSGGGGTVDGVTVTSEGDLHTISLGSLSLTVDASAGGRIVRFVVGGTETLVQDGAAAHYGATFWPSPQSWSWPPESSIEEIDSGAYTATTQASSIALTSADSEFGLRVTKTISAAAGGGISVTYGLTNVSAEPLEVAPWEIARFATGIAYYPTGPSGTLEGSTFTPTESGGYSWADYGAYDGGNAKSLADGADGWLAHALPGGTGNVLVVKSFPDVPAASIAPEEGEIEVYFAGDGSYLESEQQGSYGALAPGASRTWTVIWNGALLPAGTTLTVGSSALISAATALL